MIGAGKPRMLRLAGRYADIVSLLTVPVSSGEMVDDPAGRRTAAIRGQIDLIAEGAGDRFPQIELSIGPVITITNDPAGACRQLIASRGWDGVSEADVLDMPGVMVGSIEQIWTRMESVRAELGISYFVIPDQQMREVAPIVERLSGR
jgi:alkanesulfonate monooxygenase SsuD/methylene tetrahydromethanopterin reductase-like flavin-dependent oxidoreductase (luciferase family)